MAATVGWLGHRTAFVGESFSKLHFTTISGVSCVMSHPISLLPFGMSRWMSAMPTGSDLEIVKAKDLNSFNRTDCMTLRLQQLFRRVTQLINTPKLYQSSWQLYTSNTAFGSDAKHIQDWRDTCWKHRFMEELHQSILSSRSIQNSSNSMWICHCRYCQKLTRQISLHMCCFF